MPAAPISPPDPAEPEAWLSLDVVHDQVVQLITEQEALWNDLNERLRLIVGLIGIAFAAALGLRGFGVGDTAYFVPFWVGLLAGTAVAVYVMAALLAAISVLSRGNFNRPPRPRTLRDIYLLQDPRRTKLAIVDTLIAAYTANGDLIARRNGQFLWALAAAGAATVMLGAALIGNIAWNTFAP